jgi:DNA (cytosine-5)-methyltransferase 1
MGRIKPTSKPLKVAGLFAGIGGIELGLHNAGHDSALLCELEPGAQAVLKARFPGVSIEADVRDIKRLPDVDLVAAGFPCQDLSQAGRTTGIEGSQSGLVGEVFRLLSQPGFKPKWLLLENVPFMLQLERGKAMRYLTDTLEALGYTWAYRLVDTRTFGLPQRRQRVLLLASKVADPREVLFADDAGEPPLLEANGVACGFYWTEGVRGLGWAVDAVPTIKGGSTVGIASPPAIWLPRNRTIVTPDIRDAERLQGFPADWTLPAVEEGIIKRGMRWKMVGNAVSVPVSKWLGDRLLDPRPYDSELDSPLLAGEAWPKAAWGRKGECFKVSVSLWPLRGEYQHLEEFLQYPTTPLSARATAGFLNRAASGNLRFPEGFLAAVAAHLDSMTRETITA